MNDRLFVDLRLPHPDINLEVGSGTHAVQTAEVMRRFEPVLDAQRPSCVLVVGDVNSTLACALVCAKKAVPVVHVEAGLRSYDRRCRRKSTVFSPTRSPTACTPPSAAPTPTWRAKGLPRNACASSAT
jgi:UDP-N-acetylglucosamine 2-epimerase